MDQNAIWFFIAAGALVQLVILYIIIESATSSGRQVKNQRAIVRLLEKIAEKNGVTQEEIGAIRSENDIK